MAQNSFENWVDDAAGRDQVRRMIHHHRHGTEELLVPSRVRREAAFETLLVEVTPSLEGEEVQRAADVARFYALSLAVKNFAELLRGQEQTAMEILQSIECLRVMGDLGNGEQQAQAIAYFERLMAHPLFEKAVPGFVECFFHLRSGFESKSLAARLSRSLEAAKSSGSASDESANQVIMMEEYLAGDLPVTEHAKALRHKLLDEKDNIARATGLARLYVALDAPGGVDWVKWSGFELMREVWLLGTAHVVAGLTKALAAVNPDESSEFRTLARGRALKAIVFLKGALDKQQEKWLGEDKTRPFQLQG